MGVVIRACEVADVARVREFIAKTPPLDLHSAFTYWILFRYETELCHVALDEETSTVVGFISGVMDAAADDLCYLWQIGVHPEHRKTSVASALVNRFVTAARSAGAVRIQFSIEPTNKPSNALSKRTVRRLGFQVRAIGEVKFIDSLDNKYTYEVLFEASPSDPKSAKAAHETGTDTKHDFHRMT